MKVKKMQKNKGFTPLENLFLRIKAIWVKTSTRTKSFERRFGNSLTGFTLIELMVSMALFAFVAVAAITAMIAVLDANRHTKSVVAGMDALSFAIDSMSRELRVGNSYNCTASPTRGAAVPPYTTNDCANGTTLGFVSSDNEYIIYNFDGASGQMQRCKGVAGALDCGTNPFLSMVGSDVTITNFDFYVTGSGPTPGDENQPRVVMVISGVSGGDPDTNSTFTIQTMVTQRFPDF